MERPHQLVHFGGKDGTGFDWFTLWTVPSLPQTSKCEQVAVTRLAANIGATGSTPLLSRFRDPVEASKAEARWRNGLYLDTPEEWDDPYRFFRW